MVGKIKYISIPVTFLFPYNISPRGFVILCCERTVYLAGAPETIVINMSKLVVSVVTTVKGRDPLASEVPYHCYLSCICRFF